MSAGERGVKLPLRWKMELPNQDKQWQVDALYDQQWIDAQFPYWEGVVNVGNGKAVSVIWS